MASERMDSESESEKINLKSDESESYKSGI